MVVVGGDHDNSLEKFAGISEVGWYKSVSDLPGYWLEVTVLKLSQLTGIASHEKGLSLVLLGYVEGCLSIRAYRVLVDMSKSDPPR